MKCWLLCSWIRPKLHSLQFVYQDYQVLKLHMKLLPYYLMKKLWIPELWKELHWIKQCKVAQKSQGLLNPADCIVGFLAGLPGHVIAEGLPTDRWPLIWKLAHVCPAPGQYISTIFLFTFCFASSKLMIIGIDFWSGEKQSGDFYVRSRLLRVCQRNRLLFLRNW